MTLARCLNLSLEHYSDPRTPYAMLIKRVQIQVWSLNIEISHCVSVVGGPSYAGESMFGLVRRSSLLRADTYTTARSPLVLGCSRSSAVGCWLLAVPLCRRAAHVPLMCRLVCVSVRHASTQCTTKTYQIRIIDSVSNIGLALPAPVPFASIHSFVVFALLPLPLLLSCCCVCEPACSCAPVPVCPCARVPVCSTRAYVEYHNKTLGHLFPLK